MTGRVHGQAQNLSVTRKPTGNLFRTKDGWMVLAVMTDPQFQRLMKQLGRADATADPRFDDWPTRIANNKALHEIIEASDEAAHLRGVERDLRQERYPRRPRAHHSRDGQARPLRPSHHLQTVETEHGPIKVVGSGFRLEHDGGSVERPPAKLGEHTDEVLGEAGYSAGRDRGNADGEGRLIGPARRRSSNRGWPAIRNRPGRLISPSSRAKPRDLLIEQRQHEQVPPLRFAPVGTTEFVQGHPADVQPSK